MRLFTLCVGCGALPEGDVNVDAYPNDRLQCGYIWTPQKTINFNLADASHLPFKDNTFTEVRARHCLEHIEQPLQALKEWRRVSCGPVKVWVPSQWKRDTIPTHLYAWGPDELRNLFRKAGYRQVKVDYTSRVYAFTERHHVKTTVVNLVARLFKFYTEIYVEAT